MTYIGFVVLLVTFRNNHHKLKTMDRLRLLIVSVNAREHSTEVIEQLLIINHIATKTIPTAVRFCLFFIKRRPAPYDAFFG